MKTGLNPDTTRNIAMELVRCTEAAALMSARWMGRGDKEAGDQAAVDAMRKLLNSIDMDATVVIGEGDKDHAPMLFHGERLGTGHGPELDIAVDPVEGTRLLANGQPNAVCVIAVTERGSFYNWEDIAYMEKIAVGPRAAGSIDITKTPTENLCAVAERKGMNVRDLTAVVLDRPRHADLIREIREVGARIRLIQDGDVAGALMAALHDTGIDILMGIGGAPEAVITAAALKCIGGDMQTRLWLRNDQERKVAEQRGIDIDRVFSLDDLVDCDNINVSVTGLTDGELLEGVKFTSRGAWTHSLVLRSASGTIRKIETLHRPSKLENLSDGLISLQE